MKNLPAPLRSILTLIPCPQHQMWPLSRVAVSGQIPTAVLDLKDFSWNCPVCCGGGFITRALRDDFEMEG